MGMRERVKEERDREGLCRKWILGFIRVKERLGEIGESCEFFGYSKKRGEEKENWKIKKGGVRKINIIRNYNILRNKNCLLY